MSNRQKQKKRESVQRDSLIRKHRQDRDKMRDVSLPMIHNSKMLEEELYFKLLNGQQQNEKTRRKSKSKE